MDLNTFMGIQKDYYIGGLSLLPDDVPDGAWYQMRIDAIEHLSEPENLRMIAPDINSKYLGFDAHDIFHWLLDKKYV